jgi:hypothetical protein
VLHTCTWWCTHGGVGTFTKEKVLELIWINLQKRKRFFSCTLNFRMVLGLEFCVDSFCFGSNLLVGCVALWVSFPKCPRSSNLEFGAKSYSHFSVERSVTGLCDLCVWSAPVSLAREFGQCFLHVQKRPDARWVWLVMAWCVRSSKELSGTSIEVTGL